VASAHKCFGVCLEQRISPANRGGAFSELSQQFKSNRLDLPPAGLVRKSVASLGDLAATERAHADEAKPQQAERKRLGNARTCARDIGHLNAGQELAFERAGGEGEDVGIVGINIERRIEEPGRQRAELQRLSILRGGGQKRWRVGVVRNELRIETSRGRRADILNTKTCDNVGKGQATRTRDVGIDRKREAPIRTGFARDGGGASQDVIDARAGVRRNRAEKALQRAEPEFHPCAVFDDKMVVRVTCTKIDARGGQLGIEYWCCGRRAGPGHGGSNGDSGEHSFEVGHRLDPCVELNAIRRTDSRLAQ